MCELERCLANTIHCRLEKKHQPRDNPGDDENRYAHDGYFGMSWGGDRMTSDELDAGHVEKTNDRDYEVEER